MALPRLRLLTTVRVSGGASPHNRSRPSLIPACKMSMRGYFVRSRRGRPPFRPYLPAFQAGLNLFASLTDSMKPTITVSLMRGNRVAPGGTGDTPLLSVIATLRASATAQSAAEQKNRSPGRKAKFLLNLGSTPRSRRPRPPRKPKPEPASVLRCENSIWRLFV